MVLTFPLALDQLADLVPIVSAHWQPVWQQETSGTGGGELLAADLGPMLWEADVALRPVLNTASRPVKARLEALDGARRSFYLYDPTNCYPTHDPGGVVLGDAEVTIKAVGGDNKTLSLEGLPAGYVLSDDMLAVDYGSPARRALLRMVGSVTANGSGESAPFEVRPHLRPGIVAGLPVMLAKPAAKVKILPGSLSYEPASANRVRIRFRVRQTLQAG